MTTIRNLPNLSTTPQALKTWNSEKNRKLFSENGILSPAEVEARGIVWAEFYCKIRSIEAKTFVNLVETMIIPACMKFQKEICDSLIDTATLLGSEAVAPQKQILITVNSEINHMISEKEKLRDSLLKVKSEKDVFARAEMCHSMLLGGMTKLRVHVDKLEEIVDSKLWPFPKYSDIFCL